MDYSNLPLVAFNRPPQLSMLIIGELKSPFGTNKVETYVGNSQLFRQVTLRFYGNHVLNNNRLYLLMHLQLY